MRKFIVLSFMFLLVYNCKTVTIDKEQYFKSENSINIGKVIQKNNTLISDGYDSYGFPKYASLLKLNCQKQYFNNTTFKAIKSTKDYQLNSQLTPDSLTQGKFYLKLDIADKSTFISSFKTSNNADILELMKNDKGLSVITGVAVLFNEDVMTTLLESDELFLESSGQSDYMIKAFKNNIQTHEVKFKEGLVFAYQTSSPCWKQNDKYQVELIDFVEQGESCSNKSYKSAKRADKKINHFKL